MTESAFSAAAARRNCDTVLFEGLQNGVSRFTGDSFGCIADVDCNLDSLLICSGIAFKCVGIMHFSKEFMTDVFTLQIQLFQFLIREAIHCLWAAQEDGIRLILGCVFGDDIRCYEAMFIPFDIFIRKNMNNLDLVGEFFQLIKGFLIQDGISLAASIQQNQIERFLSCGDRFRHGQEWCDTAAAYGHTSQNP